MRNTSIREIEEQTGRRLGKSEGEPPVAGSARGSALAETFERRNGSIALLKAGFSALTRTLVAKGVCTESELVKAFEREVKAPNDSSSPTAAGGEREK